MKLNWLLDWIVDSAIAFSLVVNVINIYDLFSAHDPFHFNMGFLLIPVELMTGYVYSDRLAEKWRSRNLRKNSLIQDAIAVLSEHPTYTADGAESLILSLCRNLPPEVHEPVLRDIASRSRQKHVNKLHYYKGKLLLAI